MQQKITLFRTFTQDNQISHDEVIKFINWGKGDVQQAINYYFTNLEKGKIKRTSKEKNGKSPPKIAMKESKETKEKGKEEKMEEIQIIRPQQISISSEEESKFDSNSVDAFSVLRKGSLQHKKTHDFIKKVREIYKLPINGKPQKELINNSKACLPEHKGKMPEQFLMVDCLSQALNPEKLKQLLDKKSAQTSDPVPQVIERRSTSERLQKVQKLENISISEQIQQQMLQLGQEEFNDLLNYEYKHVYTKSKEMKNFEPIKTRSKHSHMQIQNENLNKQDSQSNSVVQINKKQIVKIKEKEITQKNQQNNQKVKEKQIKLNKSTVSVDNQTVLKKSGKNLVKNKSNELEQVQQSQLYLGEYMVRGVFTEKRKFDPSCHGCQVGIETYIEQMKTKKRNFGRKTERNMNMRVVWEGKQIGRVADEEVRIVMPLIEKNLLRIQFFFHDVPLFADILKSFMLSAKVFIQRKLITQPIIENFEPQQDDKQRVEQLSALFTKLSLPIITEPLIKAKSKYIKSASKKKDTKKQSIDIFQFETQQNDEEKKKQEMEAKNKQQLYRMRTDPFYKQKQQSLKDMITKNEESIKKSIKENHNEVIEQEGVVKKKVIQIDTQQEKDKLSQLIELHDENCEPYYPQHNFVSQLYPYQALALSWMLKRQGFLSNNDQKEDLHPLWTEYGIPTIEKYKLYFNELTGQVCVKRPVAVLKCKGGILADEMGLGKTVMMTALIVANPLPPQFKSADQAGTLVVVPLTLLSQWESQINRHTSNQKSIIYYSSDRKKIANNLSGYDVVISTYGTISHEFAQGCHTKKTGIYKYKWHRVILDEAHYIKGRIIQTSKAVYELNSTYRWCLTGTPIQNTVTDIFSLLHFIKYTPWSEFACWNRFIVKPLEEQDQSIYQILRTILKQVFLRRTKNSQGSDGKPIIELPPRISKVQLLTMSPKQREYYDSIYSSSRSSFDELIDKGILEAKYMQVLQMLMRLRQICCHPILFKSVAKFTKNTEQFQLQLNKLIKKSGKRKVIETQSQDEYYEPIIDIDNEEIRVKASSNTVSEEYLKEILEKVANQNLDNCIICLNQPQDPVITCCLHIFCKACNIRQLEEKGSCAFCRRSLTKDDYIHLPRQGRLNLKNEHKKQPLFPSTKMIALNEHLSKLKPDDKVVVFSQFLGMLDLLEDELKKNSINFVRMQGSNTHKERTRIVKSFQEDPEIQIFLVSLKTAGVGLNLVAANKVFLMDPWWNPAVEEQAIERVHRIGQKRQVQIFRFIMDKTIQTRMLELNTEKKALSQNVLNQNQDKQGNSIKHKIEKLKYLMENY